MQPETADYRKTFRLDEQAATELTQLAKSTTQGNENRAINHALTKWPKEIEAYKAERTRESENYRLVVADGREWKAKYEASQQELAQLKNALALIGKFLHPTE